VGRERLRRGRTVELHLHGCTAAVGQELSGKYRPFEPESRKLELRVWPLKIVVMRPLPSVVSTGVLPSALWSGAYAEYEITSAGRGAPGPDRLQLQDHSVVIDREIATGLITWLTSGSEVGCIRSPTRCSRDSRCLRSALRQAARSNRRSRN